MAAMLPAVRLPSVLSPASDFQQSQKFELWPTDPHPSPAASRVAATDSEGDGTPGSRVAAGASSFPFHDPAHDADLDATPTTHDDRDAGAAHVPPLVRAFSLPLAAQLGSLSHPVRHANSSSSSTSANDDYKEIALELADSVQMVIQTLLQLSPPHLLDHAKEQFSACAVQIPTPSLSALLTSMKNLNYVSANMPQLAAPTVPLADTSRSVQTTFDIGEMLQNIGDAHSGVAAQSGVDLVLYHADVGMKHISVVGDESALSYTLSYIIRQVLNVCRRGETIELGLQIVTAGAQTPLSSVDAPIDLASPSSNAPAPDVRGEVDISFEILHRLVPDASSHDEPAPTSSSISEQPTAHMGDSMTHSCRPQPRERERPDFSGVLLERLLRRVGASLRMEPALPTSKKRLSVLSLSLQRGEDLVEPRPLSPIEEAVRQPFPDLALAREPTLTELAQFTETLRGKKVVFHANSSGSFARHLSSYLTSWSMDVSHVPTDDTEEKVDSMAVPLDHSAVGSQRSDSYGQDGQPNPDTPRNMPAGPNFVVVDDDVATLKRRLLQLRTQMPYISSKPKRQRPSLAINHRPRSSHAVRQYSSGLPQISEPEALSQHVVFIHFTSLGNYRYVKDMLQTTLGTSASGLFTPEIIVVPKPAGPRRFLTALYTAVNKPVVDPFFLPIATSPRSPGTSTFSPFFAATNTQYQSHRNRQGSAASAGSSASVADRERRSPHIGDLSLQPTTPLAMDGIEYFSETAAKKVGSTPATGVVIQSSDGRPAGIFFQPQPRGSRANQIPKSGSLAVPRVVNGSSRRALEDAPDVVHTVVDLADATQVSHATLHPAKAERRTTSRGPRPFTFDVAGDSGTSGEENNAAQPLIYRPPPAGPSLSSSPSAAQLPRRASASFSITKAPQATPSSPQVSADDPTIRAGVVGRQPSTPQSNAFLPGSPMSVADAARGLARHSVGRTPSASTSDSPTVTKSQPLTSPGPVPSTSSSAQGRKTLRKPTEPVPPGQDLVADSATPARLVERARKTRTVWKGQDIVPPINVLIVEDNLINRTILSTSLKKMGVKYGQASNGQEAIEKWRKGNFHLILMDIHMPIMDGIAATREIRRLEGGPSPFPSPSAVVEPAATLQPPDHRSPFRSSVIIVALTASNLDSDRIAALAAGCNDYITKPVSLEWLRQKIMEWGSIKALQIWAEVPAKFDAHLDQRALDVAMHLKLPQSRGTSPDKPGPSRSRFIDDRHGSSVMQRSLSRLPSLPRRSVSPSPPASGSEESIATPPTPEDERQDNPTVLVTAPDTPLPSDGDVRHTLSISLEKSPDVVPPTELSGAISPIELEIFPCPDSPAAMNARK